MEKNIETLATALYVKIDDMLLAEPELAPWRPEGSPVLTISDSGLLAMAVMPALMGFRSERRWLRYASARLRELFPRQLGQSGYNKRLRKMVFLLMVVIRKLGMDTPLWTDDVWVVDSTPVQCGCSRETVTRSDVAGWAEYGYCASRSRYFWGLRLHLVCTLHGLPVMFALAGAKAGEREVLPGMLENDGELVAGRPGQTVIGLASLIVMPSASWPAWASVMNTKPSASSSSSSSSGAGVAFVPSVRLMPDSLWRPIFSAFTAASMVPVMIIRASLRCPMLLCPMVTFSSSATSSAACWVAIWASVRRANLSLMFVR